MKKEPQKIKKITNEPNSNETALVEMQNTFRDATGIRLFAEGAKWVATGMFMGTSDAVPGYAGGTTLSLLGVYQKLILMTKSMFVPEEGISRFKAFMFMLPFGIGWIAGVFGFAKLTEYMMEHNMGLELLFFFSTFVLFAIPVFLIRERPGLLDLEKKRLKKTKKWFVVFLGFSIILGVALAVLLGMDGVQFSKKSVKNTHFPLSENLNWLKLIGVAFLAGAITLIPGGSGAIVQLLSNMYDDIHWVIMAHFHENVASLFIFAFATFLGMMSMVFLMSKLFVKYKKTIAALSFGMMIGSIFAILIIPEKNVWHELWDWEHILGVIFATMLGALSGIVILVLGIKNKNKRRLIKEGIKVKK